MLYISCKINRPVLDVNVSCSCSFTAVKKEDWGELEYVQSYLTKSTVTREISPRDEIFNFNPGWKKLVSHLSFDPGWNEYFLFHFIPGWKYICKDLRHILQKCYMKKDVSHAQDYTKTMMLDFFINALTFKLFRRLCFITKWRINY